MANVPAVNPERVTGAPLGSGSRALGWGSLRHLVVGRMLVASLALPSGLLLRPDVTERPVTLLALALAAVGVVSVAWILGCRLGRGLLVQTAAQLGVDLMLVTWLSAYTGGRGSQFVLFLASCPEIAKHGEPQGICLVWHRERQRAGCRLRLDGRRIHPDGARVMQEDQTYDEGRDRRPLQHCHFCTHWRKVSAT